MNKKRIISLIALIITLSTLGQIEDWESLDKEQYSIKYPMSWELSTAGEMGTEFFIFSPQSSDQDPFRENINLMIQDISAYNINMDAYIEASVEKIKKIITDCKLLSSERIETDNDEYHRLVYNGKQGVFNLRFEQYLWVLDGDAYILTFTSEKAKFKKYKTVGQTILNSFDIK